MIKKKNLSFCIFFCLKSCWRAHCPLDWEQSIIWRWPQPSHLSQRTVLELLEQVSHLFVDASLFFIWMNRLQLPFLQFVSKCSFSFSAFSVLWRYFVYLIWDSNHFLPAKGPCYYACQWNLLQHVSVIFYFFLFILLSIVVEEKHRNGSFFYVVMRTWSAQAVERLAWGYRGALWSMNMCVLVNDIMNKIFKFYQMVLNMFFLS